MSIFKFLFKNRVANENKTKPFYKNNTDSERRDWFLKTRPWHQLNMAIIDSLIDAYKENPLFEVFVVRSMECNLVDEYAKINKMSLTDKNDISRIISSICSRESFMLLSKLSSGINQKKINESTFKNLYTTAFDLSECAIILNADNSSAFAVLAHLSLIMDKTDKAIAYAQGGLKALEKEKARLKSYPLEKSGLNLLENSIDLLDKVEVILKGVINESSEEEGLFDDDEIVYKICNASKTLLKPIDTILTKKFEVKLHHDQVADFILNFPLLVMTEADEFKEIKSLYIDYVIENTDEREIYDFDDHLSGLENHYSQWKKDFNFDLYNLKKSDTDWLFRILSDGDIEYISQESMDSFNKVLASVRNNILTICGCEKYIDKAKTDFNFSELSSLEKADPQKAIINKKVAEVSLKSTPIDYQKLNEETQKSFSEHTLIEQCKFESLDLLLINKLLNDIHNVIKSAGRIPERFLKTESSSPDFSKEFNINKLFSVFDLLSLKPGTHLDYLYSRNHPLPYTYSSSEGRLALYQEYVAKYQTEKFKSTYGREPDLYKSYPYTRDVSFDKSAIGYIQFALFNMLIGRFYLYDHANYDSRVYFLSHENLKRHINIKQKDFDQNKISIMESIDVSPKVQILNDWGKVSFLTYEMNRGYSFLNIYIKHPNVLFKIEDKVILESLAKVFY